MDPDSGQRAAIEHGVGPALVIAGPGSGKTGVITERIVFLLESVPGLQPEQILALTFTDKAAGEMKSRVVQALPALATQPLISTFHAFCYHVLREHQLDRQLLDKIDVWIFLRRRMDRLGLEFYQKLAEPGVFLHDLNDFFSRCQDELTEPADFEAYVTRLEEGLAREGPRLDAAELKVREEEILKKRELARVFRNSRRLLEESGCSSLGSLIRDAIRLWDREPEVLEGMRTRFRYVLVDEFQDTNFAQVELLRRLVAPPYNITAVGDADQAIYRFRGAAHGAFEMFQTAFPDPRNVHLGYNYRSTKRILRVAEVVIGRNDRGGPKPPLETRNDEGAPVQLVGSPDYQSEAVWVAEEVKRLAAGGRWFGDIAILYRAHGYRDLLVEALRGRAIPLTIRGLSILAAVIVRDLVAYLKLVNSPHDNISLTRVLLTPRWRFPEALALTIRKQALRDRCSLFDVIEASGRTPLREELGTTGWHELRDLLAELRKAAAHASVTEVYDQLTDRLGLRFLPGDPDDARVQAFRTFLGQWEKKSETRTLREFMEYFHYFREAGGVIEDPQATERANAVQLMTVHAAKGLEFPVVFILSVARQRFPHREQRPVIEFPDALRKGPRPPADIHLQEERRLLYVGMTRAKERLYISSVARPGRQRSAFIDDLERDPVVSARDIEKIEGGEAAPGSSPAPPPGDVSRLIGRTVSLTDAVRPPVARWAGASPAPDPQLPLRLSATAIEDYRDCPLKFKLSHYFKVPTGPQAPLTFGSLMHRCVRRYFELRKGGMPCAEEIEQFYLEGWRRAGYQDDYQEAIYKKAGLEQLRAFAERQNARPIDVDAIRFEEPFELDLGACVLEGRIDQVNAIGNHSVELIDYKTGKPRSQKDADKSLQLTVYALAARRALKREPVRLTFYNLSNNQPVSTVRTSKDLDQAVEDIQDVAEQIRRSLFDPTPGFVCKYCDFVPICFAHEKDI